MYTYKQGPLRSTALDHDLPRSAVEARALPELGSHDGQSDADQHEQTPDQKTLGRTRCISKTDSHAQVVIMLKCGAEPRKPVTGRTKHSRISPFNRNPRGLREPGAKKLEKPETWSGESSYTGSKGHRVGITPPPPRTETPAPAAARRRPNHQEKRRGARTSRGTRTAAAPTSAA